MNVRIYVTLKTDVLDPQGKAIEKSLHRLGYDGASHVRVGKYIEMKLETSDRKIAGVQIDEMCRKLLSNPVIEDARYEFAD
ncbi:MAG: phosphoribosylformylglycinamidine synthase subunit PurS [Pseudomonadota bacterium]